MSWQFNISRLPIIDELILMFLALKHIIVGSNFIAVELAQYVMWTCQ